MQSSPSTGIPVTGLDRLLGSSFPRPESFEKNDHFFTFRLPEGTVLEEFWGRFKTTVPLTETDSGANPRNGVMARTTNPGNRAHAFRITVVEHLTPSNNVTSAQQELRNAVCSKFDLVFVDADHSERGAAADRFASTQTSIKKYVK